MADRGVVRVAGEDASKLLQGVITNDMGLLATRPALHAALLTPQGKILFDFFVVTAPGGFLLETAADKTAELARRLAMYRLRAKAEITDASGEYRVFVAWGGDSPDLEAGDASVSFPDPRLPQLGIRILGDSRFTPAGSAGTEAAAADYHAHRIALGVPEGGKDYAFADAFPHEADMDQLGGVSFTKGCFVGQEVVSRMQNRAAVRKRVVPLMADAPLTPGAEVHAGAAAIGKVGSTSGRHALALVRLDRAAEAVAKGEPLTAGGVPVKLGKPSWARFELAPAAVTTP
ncbi:MAG TPA: folate-binding protein [Hyphomicrobiaceae bacterium]|nr:folate-binding protein [Hyphomicrobiaceae bacterium]